MKALLAATAAVVFLGAMPAPAAVTVHIKNFAYAPATLTVKPGTVVRFVNDDGEAHTVTATDKSFDSAGLDTGDAWTHDFATPGKYAYFCALHPYMHGTVVVSGGN
ncbi:MAG: cupredoxin family copper-binding protein [Candidatus Eremiobacteraeota bacterium]|nr:cupredoxin family copper-binding protein [Candidatus Eremiobacteraeota bacterium]